MSTFTRYTKSVPEGVIVCDTYEELSAVADKYPDTGLWPEDGGYLIKDSEKGKIFAVASDALIPELDRRNADLDAWLEKHPEERPPEDPEELEAWAAANPGHCTKADASSTDCDRNTNEKSQVRHDTHPNACAHHYCHSHATCRTYKDCHVCQPHRNRCI